jgi:Zn-finger nucleic acid-binding protein
MTWAMLLKRTFNVDIEICPSCGGKRKIMSAILDRKSIRKILVHVGIDPDPPETTPARYDQLVCGF